MSVVAAIDTAAARAWYRRNRARSEAIFDLIDPAAYYTRPIALRNPIVFYEGHLPAFSVIAFLRRGLGLPPVDARLEKLFERGIDPDSVAEAAPRSGAATMWPARDEVRAFAAACDAAMLRAMESLPSDPAALEGLYTALEHEAMHQETLLYMWHRMAYGEKHRPMTDDRWPMADGKPITDGRWPMPDGSGPIVVPAGDVVLGADRAAVPFGWDNEFDRHIVHVPAFDIDVLPVTNAEYLDFMNATGQEPPAFWLTSDPSAHLRASRFGGQAIGHRSSNIDDWHWRGMFEGFPLPPDWPVYVSQEDASAYARWRGRRLMTEPEFHRAAEGATPGHVDFAGFDPVPVASHPETVSRHGVHDLIGNGWEWTSTVFAPFDGFTPMRSYPEYSADFFDGQHFVMKGASPATARELIRPSFRNWFRGNYPYVYAKFRTAATR